MIDDCKKYGLTREDFIKYKEYFFKMLEETEVKNTNIDIIGKSVNQKHDKSIKEILSNKKEMAKFLEQFLGFKVDTEQLEEQKNNYINKQFEKRESDILYKIKNKDIYILVEHQSKVDKRMPRRIFEYCMGIMMALEKLININKFSKTELLEKNTKLTSMMVFEKCKTKEELKSEIVEMLLRAQSKERIKWIQQLIQYVFADKLGEDGNKILEILEKGEMSAMEDLFERIEINEAKIRKSLINKGIRRGKTVGRLEGIIENMMNTIKNMLKQNEDEEKIMKYTNAKREDIEKAKKELGMC